MKRFFCCNRYGLALLLALVLSLVVLSRARAAEPAKGENPALKAASALYEGIRTETLPNGLRIYLKPVPGATTVTTMVAYKVGSSDEDLEHTGLSHYLEHLMFKGTDKIKPGDIDHVTLRNGGANNAYTSEDMTVYHFDFAADRWEVALEIEADRMRNLRIDKAHEFEQEKGAVIQELQRNEDEPWDLEGKALLPPLFGKGNPYGHPVIGERQHVRDATAEVIKSHYDKWYHPNNASLIVCGGFDADKALARIKELFGPIPSAKLPARKPVAEVKTQRPAHVEMDSKFESPRMLMAFNIVPSKDPDAAALEVVSAILSGGKTSRMYKKFVEGEEIASDIDTTNYPGRYPGYFALNMELFPGKDRTKAEKLLVEELERLRKEPISEAELNRAKEQLLSANIFGRESVHGLADSIAKGVTTNDLDYLRNYLPSLRAVTVADVERVAKKYLDPEQRVVVWSYPKKDGAGGPQGRGQGVSGARARSALGADKETGGGLALTQAQRVVLPNGLVLLLFENHRLPIVVAAASVRNTALLEPADKSGLGVLTGYLLSEGTTKHSGPQIAEAIESVGGALALTSSGGEVRMLSNHRTLGLSLLLECLAQSNFPKAEFERQKNRLLSEIRDAERRPEARATQVFKAEVYGKHPYGRPTLGTVKHVEPLTPEDCAAFFHQAFVPNNTILAIVGDFNSKEVVDEVTRLTADWKKAEVSVPKPPEVKKPEKFTQKIVTMPEAAQMHFFLGHVGIRRNDPDYYKLVVMDYVLGTGPGFTDRLSSRLRDREGLAYTVQANISSTAGEEPGVFTCYIGCDANKFATVKKEFLEELNRIRDTLPEKDEVEDAKKYLLGNLAFKLTTNASIAAELLYVERHGLALDYLADYRKAIEAVTPEDVQAVAKKHLDPEHMVLVVTGAVDAKGEPLKPAETVPPKEGK